ncbi:hypothetical protein NC797_16535 [Aquibacillus sp. 3ASR75-11]|uniref:F5/8 type C domain-containing protein n=1 Tax=Terrihalobacillus insolitus TaxID=2950438 RepID=A0A9X3WUX7_9BACI|nr:hypothetical protein [Terrihalobacillus insolitus]MDC3414895.1 hypothetical protein [Terrihalobacillus insolitus]MDC3426105.1 hypothetical protein [Terrihalobacillus insolitus]
MRKKVFLMLGVLLALAVTSVSYAATNAAKSVTVNSGQFATVTAASGTDGPTGIVDFPNWKPAKGVSGTTGKSDLYIIDPNSYTGDVYGTLYLGNAGDLAKNYSFLNLNVKIYGKSDSATSWTEVETTVLSLANGFITFTLSGGFDSYAVSISSGSYYAISTDATDGSLSPDFYVEIK